MNNQESPVYTRIGRNQMNTHLGKPATLVGKILQINNGSVLIEPDIGCNNI